MKLELDSFELYKEKIKYFIEMEKQKLIKDAVKSGLKEEDVILFLQEENISDFDLESLL